MIFQTKTVINYKIKQHSKAKILNLIALKLKAKSRLVDKVPSKMSHHISLECRAFVKTTKMVE